MQAWSEAKAELDTIRDDFFQVSRQFLTSSAVTQRKSTFAEKPIENNQGNY